MFRKLLKIQKVWGRPLIAEVHVSHKGFKILTLSPVGREFELEDDEDFEPSTQQKGLFKRKKLNYIG